MPGSSARGLGVPRAAGPAGILISAVLREDVALGGPSVVAAPAG